MPQIVGVCLTYPRQSLAQVLGCWARQTYPCELFLFSEQGYPTLGAKRNAAVRGAIRYAQLGVDDWIVNVDDDDHYAPWHVDTIARAVQQNPRAGLIAPPCYGVLRPRWSNAPGLSCVPVSRHAAPWMTLIDYGVGPHGGCAFRVGAWLQVGGYRDTLPEDVPMMQAMRLMFGATYSEHSSYIHIRTGGDHAAYGAQPAPTPLRQVPQPDRHYSQQQQSWDRWLALHEAVTWASR